MGQSASPAAAIVSQNMATKNTAKNCIFILLTGAISPRDSWDLKITSDLNPAVVSQMNPTMINNVNWPVGIFPKLGQHLGDVALVRSMSAWALVHSLAQTWAQIGRNPAAALGNIAPNIGSVVAIEKDKERKPGQVFPTFVALNSGGGRRQRLFPRHLCALPAESAERHQRNGRHSGHHQRERPERVQHHVLAAAPDRRSAAHSIRPTASRCRITTRSTAPPRG